MRELNILFINSIQSNKWGGVEKWMITVAEGLKIKGHSVYVCGRPEGRFIGRAKESGITTFPLKFRGDIDPLTSFSLKRIIRQKGINVLCLTADRELRLLLPVFPFGKKPFIAVRKGLPELKDCWRNRILFTRLVDTIITPARSAADTMISQLRWLEESKVVTVPNGVVIPVKTTRGKFRKEQGISDKVFLGAVVSRLTPQKGHIHLLKAIAVLKEELSDFLFVIAGDGVEMDSLKKAAHNLNIEGLVRFLGHRWDTSAIIEDADLIVLPSFFEGMPNILLEAMAHRTAIIATDIAGIDEVITSPDVGRLVPPGDSDAIARSIIEMKNDSILRIKMADAAFTYVKRKFPVQLMIDSVERIFINDVG